MALTSLGFIPLHTHPFPPNPNPQSLSFPACTLTSPLKSRPPALASLSSNPPPGPSLDADGGEDEEVRQEVEFGDGIEIEVVKVSRNRRRVRASVGVDAELETVWGVLTDYEGLAEFIPSLSVCKLLEKGDKYAKLFQVGQQNLALGLKFNAKGILDCYEKELEPSPYGRRRDIEFKMVEGDFQIFEGKWSILQNDKEIGDELTLGSEQFCTLLSYVVELEPKLWLPVRLVEGRICKEVRNNLSCIRKEAQRIQEVAHTLP